MKIFTGVVFWLTSGLWSLMAQPIQISLPVERAVYQRSNNNSATIRITGYYTTPISRVEARFIARNGQGTSTDWTVIQNGPRGGVYAGDMTVQGGWYALEVRGMQGDQEVAKSGVERVGVGEVFVIAGQSNAQGVPTAGIQGASDDRVNCVNASEPSVSNADPAFPTFRHLDADVIMAPRGFTAWYWGLLGDRLAQRLNVPVMFFNAGWGGTSVQNWQESAFNGVTFSIYVTGLAFPAGQPYANLRISLQYYAHTFGVRAVLWHQGEADNLLNTSAERYSSLLRSVIDKSRQDIGRNVSWVIAQASHDDKLGSDGGVIAGQQRTIASAGNTYNGPFTDNIQIPRGAQSEFVHFNAGSMPTLADVWSSSLNDGFFASSQPITPTPGPTVAIDCAGGNNLSLRVEGSYSQVIWESGEQSQTVVKGGGFYRARVKDGLGRTNFTPTIRISDAPAVSAEGNPNVCEGSTVKLISNYDNSRWSNGVTGRSIEVNQAGNYSVRFNDVSGCEFTSNTATVQVFPLPPTPGIAAESPTTFCQGDKAVLRAGDGPGFRWSNGDRGQRIEVRSAGRYTVQAQDQNGCLSPPSSGIDIVVNPLPPTPTLTASGPTTFCADQTITLTLPEQSGYLWNSGQQLRSITVNQSGQYRGQTRNEFGCLSFPSNTIDVTVKPLPPTPTLTASGPTTFCDGDRVTLFARSALPIRWTTGQTDTAITVRQSGQYSARAIGTNGCLSLGASAILVDAKPLPSTPTIEQVGTFTLEAKGARTGNDYRWARDADSLAVRTGQIKASQSGTYAVQASLVYSTVLTCFSARSAPFRFEVDPSAYRLSVYPNPSPDKVIQIETLDDLTSAAVIIYNLEGQIVYKNWVESFNQRRSVNLYALTAGTYLLRVRGPNYDFSRRIIIGN